MNFWQGEGVHPGVVEANLITHIPSALEALLVDARLQAAVAIETFDAAVERLDSELAANEERAAQIHRSAAEILDAQRLMLRSNSFLKPVRDHVAAGNPPAGGLSHVVEVLTARLSRAGNAAVKEKIQDIRDLAAQLAHELVESANEDASYAGAIVAVPQPMASTLFHLLGRNVAGVAIFDAGVTSHMSIIASSLGIPTAIFPCEMPEFREPGPYRLDGAKGELGVRGAEGESPHMRAPRFVALGSRMAFTFAPGLQKTTRLWVNLNLPSEAERAIGRATGVGLYRSEFAWGLAGRVPEEEEQYADYRAVAEHFAGMPLHLRTADVGGDKIVRGIEQREEANPFLGVRGIRGSLEDRGLFRRQLRALLRAGHGADLGIMFPMVTSVEEITIAREEVVFARYELEEERVLHNPRPRIGAMIETPAAALAVERLAASVDFLSIGTNDLVMYLLAVDRTNSRLSGLYSPLHPIVLQTVARVVRAAKEAKVHVSVCGQSAANPKFLPFLVGLGVDAVSVAVPRLADVRTMLDEFSAPFCRAYANRLLAAESVAAVRKIVGVDH